LYGINSLWIDQNMVRNSHAICCVYGPQDWGKQDTNADLSDSPSGENM